LSRPVFLYGTLLDPRVFRRQAGTLRPWRQAVPALLPGFRRVHLRGTPYPTLVAAADEVAGLIVRLPPMPLESLRRYEGPSYRLCPVRAVTRRGPRAARAWMTAPRRAEFARPWPAHAGM
jgi:gamma-glutamylcyclotransferase (GGCT)/AIG2-like uncharacterized protein YtfP